MNKSKKFHTVKKKLSWIKNRKSNDFLSLLDELNYLSLNNEKLLGATCLSLFKIQGMQFDGQAFVLYSLIVRCKTIKFYFRSTTGKETDLKEETEK